MLKRSADRKVTNSVSANGKSAKIANSFGLPSGRNFSCPGATSVCEKVCYAGKLEKIYSGVRNVLVENWETLQGKSVDEMTTLLSRMIAVFVAESEERGAEKVFRIHWDGDFFSEDYTMAWANVIRAFPDVRFWVYTRSFTMELNVIPMLIDIPNLSLWLSVDSANIHEARVIRKEFPEIGWAWLGNTFAEGREELDDSGKTYDCPENAKRIPLISEKGSACLRCRICVSPKRTGSNVVFSVRKR